jgi:hypothetical protein
LAVTRPELDFGSVSALVISRQREDDMPGISLGVPEQATQSKRAAKSHRVFFFLDLFLHCSVSDKDFRFRTAEAFDAIVS